MACVKSFFLRRMTPSSNWSSAVASPALTLSPRTLAASSSSLRIKTCLTTRKAPTERKPRRNAR